VGRVEPFAERCERGDVGRSGLYPTEQAGGRATPRCSQFVQRCQFSIERQRRRTDRPAILVDGRLEATGGGYSGAAQSISAGFERQRLHFPASRCDKLTEGKASILAQICGPHT
jgi:hypothetical protein